MAANYSPSYTGGESPTGNLDHPMDQPHVVLRTSFDYSNLEIHPVTLKKKRRCPFRIHVVMVLILCLVVLAGMLAVILFLATNDPDDKHTELIGKPTDSNQNALEYFDVNDAAHIIWAHGVNNQSYLQEILNSNAMMLEGDIMFRFQGTPNQTDEPIMAHLPDIDGDLTLEEWLDAILTSDKAPKLDFKSLEVSEAGLHLLAERENLVSQPVWVNADIVQGPGTDNEPIDGHSFLYYVNSIYPLVTLSLGWTTGCCEETYNQHHMEEMWMYCSNLTQKVTLPARAAYYAQAWDHFRWLITQEPSKFSITVWTPKGEMDWEGANLYEMLMVRNDIPKTYIYYDLPGEKYNEFMRLSTTAGNPLNYFYTDRWDGVMISWASHVNNHDILKQELQGNKMMIGGDVRKDVDQKLIMQGIMSTDRLTEPEGEGAKDVRPPMKLSEWLTEINGTNKGLKISFMETDAIYPTLLMLNQSWQSLQPLWLHADVIQGPNTNSTGIDQTPFKVLINRYTPEVTVSLGFTSEWRNKPDDSGYTQEMFAEMTEYAQQFKQPVNFVVRASMATEAWDYIEELLDQSRGYKLTIWVPRTDFVNMETLMYIRRQGQVSRIFYDLPDDLMSSFMTEISKMDQ